MITTLNWSVQDVFSCILKQASLPLETDVSNLVCSMQRVFNPLYGNVYDKQPNTIQPIGLPVKSHFDINFDDIAPIVIRENFYGKNQNLSLISQNTKEI